MVRQQRLLTWSVSVGVMVLMLFMVNASLSAATTGIVTGGSVVGGVEIDVNGVLSTAPQKSMEEVGKTLTKLLEPLPGDLNQESMIRKISLKKLNEQMSQIIGKKGEFPRFNPLSSAG